MELCLISWLMADWEQTGRSQIRRHLIHAGGFRPRLVPSTNTFAFLQITRAFLQGSRSFNNKIEGAASLATGMHLHSWSQGWRSHMPSAVYEACHICPSQDLSLSLEIVRSVYYVYSPQNLLIHPPWAHRHFANQEFSVCYGKEPWNHIP
jgi:hypothetical protein